MPLNIGTRLGPYEVLSAIGAGGMGEVYKARDTRLDRVVAIKVLPEKLAADPEFRQRFEREAKSISALDHPHICTLYDLGEGSVPAREAGLTPVTVSFLVMQYLEGETLAVRLTRSAKAKSHPSGVDGATAVDSSSALTMARGPLSLEQVLRHGAEIALALDAAHRRGIVHRDLKPGNVMLTKSGVKLLDFGLAKIAGDAPVSGFGDAATRTTPLTAQGTILGTLQYMSPEQLEGREVDARSDIFSFGAMLFEMLTGRQAFESQSPAGTIAAILNADPPPLTDLADIRTTLPRTAHRALDRLLSRCLAKDPDERWHSAADLAAELKWIDQERQRIGTETEPAGDAPAAPLAPASRTRERIWMAATITCALAAAGLFWWRSAPAAVVGQVVTFELAAPADAPFASGPGSLALSPDGTRLAFVARGRGATKQALWLRSLDSVTAREIPNTEDAWQPTWSPDSRYVTFGPSGGNGRLRRVDVQSGAAVTLADPAAPAAAWSSAGVIVFAGGTTLGGGGRGGLYRVNDSGGPITPLTDLDRARQEIGHAWPVFLSDGRRFIYLAQSSDRTKSAIYLASLDGPNDRTHLIDVHSMAAVSSGYLLYARDGTLMAHAFDEARGQLIGDPVPIVEGIQTNERNGRVNFTVSATGTLAYRAGRSITQGGVLTWFDFAGKRLGTVGEQGRFRILQISPDGRHLAAQMLYGDDRKDDVWLIDLERGVRTRFTTDEANDASPVWLPDGSGVIFGSNRSGVYQLYRNATAGVAGEEVLFDSPEEKAARAVSSDGKVVLFERAGGGTGLRSQNDIWALPLTGDRTPRAVVASRFDEGAPSFSPDGRWIAYYSNVSGEREVYAQAFPTPGVVTRISTASGSYPHWTSDAKTIVYFSGENNVTAVDVTVVGGELRASTPRTLFASPGRLGRTYAFDPVGRRFLFPMTPETAEEAPVTIVFNWAAGLQR